MFAKLAILSTITMAAFVAAAPGINNSCNTGPVQCCNSLHSAESADFTALAALVGASVGAITGQIGANCSPLSVLQIAGGTKCGTQPVCCTDNSFNGLVNVGCTPVNAGL